MDTCNPYKSPDEPAENVDTTRRWFRRAIVYSSLLVFTGVCFLLLLDGQVFTNTLVFMGLCAVSSLLWIPLLIPSPRNQHRRLVRYVILGHLLVIIAFAVGLPEMYRSQKQFNTPRHKRSNTQSTTAPGGN